MNTSGVHNLILEKNIEVSNTLTLTNGKIETGTNSVTLTNTDETQQLAGGSANSYVYSTGAGRLRRNGIAASLTNTHVFPVGSRSLFTGNY
jgi:hypothetical protein